LACPDLGNGPKDKRGIDPEHSIVSIIVKYSDVSRENKRYQVCGDLKVQVKQPVIGSALFLNRSDGSVICRRLSFETASVSYFAIPADERILSIRTLLGEKKMIEQLFHSALPSVYHCRYSCYWLSCLFCFLMLHDTIGLAFQAKSAISST